MAKIRIDYAKCVGTDKLCVDICPMSVFRDTKTTKPEIANENDCILCRTCQVNCPVQAIEISA